MRLPPCIIAAACGLLASPAPAQDGARFAERTPLPLRPPAHTMERAGNPRSVAWWAVPSVGRSEAGGYVGGARLFGGIGGTTGPVTGGTFGWDYVGPRLWARRVFLAPSADPSAGSAITRRYRTDGPVLIPDVIQFRPLRRAVLEKKEATGGQK